MVDNSSSLQAVELSAIVSKASKVAAAMAQIFSSTRCRRLDFLSDAFTPHTTQAIVAYDF